MSRSPAQRRLYIFLLCVYKTGAHHWLPATNRLTPNALSKGNLVGHLPFVERFSRVPDGKNREAFPIAFYARERLDCICPSTTRRTLCLTTSRRRRRLARGVWEMCRGYSPNGLPARIASRAASTIFTTRKFLMSYHSAMHTLQVFKIAM